MANDFLNIIKGLDALAHTQAEVSEPLVIQSNRPVFGQELHSVRNDAIIVAFSQLIEIVLMKAYKGPQTLQNDLFIAHVGDRVDEADRVECKLNEVAFTCGTVKIVTCQVRSILDLLLAWLEDKWVRRLDVIVDDIIRQDTTLALRQEEQRELFVLFTLSSRGLMGVMDVKHASGQA